MMLGRLYRGSQVTIDLTTSAGIDMEVPTELRLEMLHPNSSKDKRLLLVLNTTFTVGVQFEIIKEIVVDEEGQESSAVKLQGKLLRVL